MYNFQRISNVTTATAPKNIEVNFYGRIRFWALGTFRAIADLSLCIIIVLILSR